VKFKPYKTIKDKKLEYIYDIAKINENEIAVSSSKYNKYGDIRIYNWVDSSQNVCTHVLKGHKSSINCLILSEDKATLITCSHDRTIKIWSLSNYTCIKTLKRHSRSVYIYFNQVFFVLSLAIP